MAKQKPKKKGIVRFLRAVIIIVVLAIAGLAGASYFLPMLTTDSITTYTSYTVETGDIETMMSFSATLEVKNTESFTPGEMTKIKELYVNSGDDVSKGDPLMLFTNGELFTASFDGVVSAIRFGVGDWVREYFSVVQVSDLVNLDVTLSVDEYDIKSLAVGDPCTVKVISLDEDFATTIAHINRVSSSSGTLAYYTVSCELAVPPEVLPGMRATVMIPDQSVTGVNTLAMDALAFDAEEQAYVLRKQDDGSYEKQTVGIGLSDGLRVEITGGLQAGDVVYAVSGTESVEPDFSLEDLYIALVGKKTVINGARGQMPERTGDVPESFTDNAGNADGMAFNPMDAEPEQDTGRTPDTQPASPAADEQTQTEPQSAQPAQQPAESPQGGRITDTDTQPE